MARSIVEHLSEEEFVDYALGEIDPEANRDIDAHLERCPVCCGILNDYFEAEESLPEADLAVQSQALVEVLQKQLEPAEPLGVLKELRSFLQAAASKLFPWTEPNLALAAASNPDQISEDGRFSTSVWEDDDRTFCVRISTTERRLTGFEVVVRAGSWMQSKRLTEELGVIRADFRMPLESRRQLHPADALQCDVVAGA